MKYAIGGISGKTGQMLSLEVPIAGTPAPKAPPPKPAQQQAQAPKEAPPPEQQQEAPAKPTGRPDYPLLPEDMKAKYLSMSFILDGEQVQFSLQHLKYQNLGLKMNFKEETKNVLVGLFNETKKKDLALLQELAGDLANGSPAFIMHACSGKGSPDQIRACLRIAGHFKKRLGRDWQDKGDLSASIAAFYYETMGLDCSGFAGNYARAVGGTALEPNTPIPSFAPPGKRRKKLDEILPGDLVIWGKKHIATIQGRRPDGAFDIVESSGETGVEGLGNTIRELTETGGDSMKIRKQGSKNSPEDVYVSTIK